MKGILLVGAGGAAGSILRYLISLAAMRVIGAALWGTLAVNVVGSFAIAVLAQFAIAGVVSDETRMAIGAGVLGGFTTYSSFNNDALTLASSGQFVHAAAYVLGTVVACLVAGLAGGALGRALIS